MKILYALLLTMFFAQNSYSQSKLFDIGGFVKEKIQEGSRTVIGKMIVVLTLYSSTAGMFKLPIVSP